MSKTATSPTTPQAWLTRQRESFLFPLKVRLALVGVAVTVPRALDQFGHLSSAWGTPVILVQLAAFAIAMHALWQVLGLRSAYLDKNVSEELIDELRALLPINQRTALTECAQPILVRDIYKITQTRDVQ